MKSLNINIPTTIRFIKAITHFWVIILITTIGLLYAYFWLNTEECQKDLFINIESIFTVNTVIGIRFELQKSYLYCNDRYTLNKYSKNKTYDNINFFYSHSKVDTNYFHNFSKFSNDANHYYNDNKDNYFNNKPFEILSYRPGNKNHTIRPIMMCQLYSEDIKYFILPSDKNRFESSSEFITMKKNMDYIQYDNQNRDKTVKLINHGHSISQQPCLTLKFYEQFFSKKGEQPKVEIREKTTDSTYYSQKTSDTFSNITTQKNKRKDSPETSEERISSIYNLGGAFFDTFKSHIRTNIYVNTKNYNSDINIIPDMSIEFDYSDYPLYLLSLSPEPDYRTPNFFGYDTPQKIEQVCNQGIILYAEIIKNKERNEKLNFLLASIIGVLFSILAEIGVKHFSSKRTINPSNQIKQTTKHLTLPKIKKTRGTKLRKNK